MATPLTPYTSGTLTATGHAGLAHMTAAFDAGHVAELNISTLQMMIELFQIENSSERSEPELASIRNEYNDELRNTLEMMIHLTNPKLRELKRLYNFTKDNIDVATKLMR